MGRLLMVAEGAYGGWRGSGADGED
jgi:hypothetical protein